MQPPSAARQGVLATKEHMHNMYVDKTNTKAFFSVETSRCTKRPNFEGKINASHVRENPNHDQVKHIKAKRERQKVLSELSACTARRKERECRKAPATSNTVALSRRTELSQLLAVEEREGKLGGRDGDDRSKAEQTRIQWGNKRIGHSLE